MSHAVSKIKTAVPTTLSKCLWVNNLSSLTSRFWHGVYISQCLDSSVSVNGLSPAAISPSTRASRVFTSEAEDMQRNYVFFFEVRSVFCPAGMSKCMVFC